MDLERLYDFGFSAEQIVSSANAILNCDDICFVLFHTLVDNDCKVPRDIREHYEDHCSHA